MTEALIVSLCSYGLIAGFLLNCSAPLPCAWATGLPSSLSKMCYCLALLSMCTTLSEILKLTLARIIHHSQKEKLQRKIQMHTAAQSDTTSPFLFGTEFTPLDSVATLQDMPREGESLLYLQIDIKQDSSTV